MSVMKGHMNVVRYVSTLTVVVLVMGIPAHVTLASNHQAVTATLVMVSYYTVIV